MNNILQQRHPNTIIITDETTSTPLQSLPQPPHVTHTTTSNNSTITPSQRPTQRSAATHTVNSNCHAFTSSQSPPSTADTTPTNPYTITPPRSSPSMYNPSSVTPTANHHTITPLQALPTSPIQQTFRKPPHFPVTPQPQRGYINTPLSHGHQIHSTSFTSLLEEDDFEEFEELCSAPDLQHIPTKKCSEWESFTSHFTEQFEKLKAEVEGLRAELKSVKRTVRELKVISCFCIFGSLDNIHVYTLKLL